MKQNQGPRRYRIGEYASYMGVTPDFLKHYEKKHIISADVQDSGYRYYRFRESCRILECMRLRNYGFTVRDMAEAVNCMDGDQAWQMLEEKAAAMEKQVELETAILEEHRRIRDWMQRIRGKGEDWVVQRMEPFYFLPHSHHNDFLKDPRIYDILNRWVSWMPVVKSALQIQWDGSGEEEMNSAWGPAKPRSCAMVSPSMRRCSGFRPARRWSTLLRGGNLMGAPRPTGIAGIPSTSGLPGWGCAPQAPSTKSC